MNALDLEIKPLTEEHLGGILKLDRDCFGGLWTMEAYQRELDSPNSYFIGLFAPVFTNQLVAMGCLWSILEEAHITILAVHPDFQGQGLGQTVLWGLLETSCELGLERATLEVRVSNTAAISLYHKFGFKTAGRRRRYYQDTGEDALILWRGDLQHPESEKNLALWRSGVCDRLTASGWNLQTVAL